MYFLTFDYFYGPYLICKCTCTFTCMNSSLSPIFKFHQNNSQLLIHIIVSLRGAGAFRRDFTTHLALQCWAFSGTVKRPAIPDAPAHCEHVLCSVMLNTSIKSQTYLFSIHFNTDRHFFFKFSFTSFSTLI